MAPDPMNGYPYATKVDSQVDLSKFVSVVCHDLHGPVRIISSYSELLRASLGNGQDERIFTDRFHKYLNAMATSCERLQQLFEDLHMYGNALVNPWEGKPFDMEPVIVRAWDSVQTQNRTREVELHIPEVVKRPVYGNSDAVETIWRHLFANAWEFAHPDRPLAVRVQGEETDSHHRFEVSDNGQGIAKDRLNEIGIPFRKLSDNHPPKGTGLGLATVTQLVEKHGGEVQVSSEQGKGTSVIFSLKKTGVAPCDL